ncbi:MULTISPECIES: hypothetical protein [Nostocales]|uniref:hypothetical protein n=1 Tax=Nostocales TaxID=1161 RepID=UPI00168A3B5A|nr:MULTISPECIES: hypothetical protein [Nostocales]
MNSSICPPYLNVHHDAKTNNVPLWDCESVYKINLGWDELWLYSSHKLFLMVLC